jgi:putative chitinase
MRVTLEQLRALAPRSPAKFAEWVEPLNAALAEFGITTEQRIEMFLAQTLHETLGYSALSENLNYSAAGLANTWERFSTTGKRGGPPNALAKALERRPQAIASNVYANRLGNGSEAGGEGWLYRGRGLLHTTGKANYEATQKGTGIPCLSNPDALLEPLNAARAAGWFWKAHGLNEIADAGNFKGTTKVVNGADIGGAERIGLWNLTQKVIA